MVPTDTSATADPMVRGMLVALAALGTVETDWPALGDRRREACARATRALEDLGADLRDENLAEWRQEAEGGWWKGVSRLHPTWIEDALSGERAEIGASVRSAVGPGRAAPPEQCLARVALGNLLALWDSDAGPMAERLCGLSCDDLLEDILRRGARTVGRSLAGAEPALQARAMAFAGEPWAQEIAAGALATVSAEERASAVAIASAAAASGARTSRERLLAAGLATLEMELGQEPPGSVYRVAGRLPAGLGRSLLGW